MYDCPNIEEITPLQIIMMHFVEGYIGYFVRVVFVIIF